MNQQPDSIPPVGKPCFAYCGRLRLDMESRCCCLRTCWAISTGFANRSSSSIAVWLGVGRIEDLCQQRAGRFRLRWSGEGEAFTGLKNEGVTVTVATSGDQAQVDVPDHWTTQQLFERSLAADIVLNEVIPEEEDLQQVYRRLVLK